MYVRDVCKSALFHGHLNFTFFGYASGLQKQ